MFRSHWLRIFAVVIAGLISLPVVIILSYVANANGELWQHLIDTVLNDYLLNSNSYENSFSVSEYVLQIIINIYPKDFVKKYLYIEQ